MTTIAPLSCDDIFESLSAFIDDMADTHETRQVEEHLAACDTCRETARTLRAVSVISTEPSAPVPTGFAARTARQVRERANRSWRERLRQATRALTDWIDVGEPNPLSTLLRSRAAQSNVRPASLWAGLAVVLFGAPSVTLQAAWSPESGAAFLMAAALAMLIAVPISQALSDVALMVSLRKGRCLDEVVVSGMSAGEIVDIIALHGVRTAFRTCWPMALLLLLGALLFPAVPHTVAEVVAGFGQPTLAPAYARALAVGAAALWLPAVCAMTACLSYAEQAKTLFKRDGVGTSTASIVVFVLLALTSVPGWVLLGSVMGLFEGTGLMESAGAGEAALGLVAGAVLCAVLGRSLATWGIRNLPLLERWSRNALSRQRNPFVRPPSENPITMREMRRQATAVPGGLAGLFVARLLPVLLPGGAVVLLLSLVGSKNHPAEWPGYWICGALVIAATTFVRAAHRTSTALVQEREQGTFDVLLQSGLTPQEFIHGWLEVTRWPLYLGLAMTVALGTTIALAAPEVLGWELSSDPSYAYGTLLLSIVAVSLSPWAGTWVGLGISSVSLSRREAIGKLALTATQMVLLSLVVWCVLGTVVTRALSLGPVSYDCMASLMDIVLPLAAFALASVALSWRGRRQVDRHLVAFWHEAPPATEPICPTFALQQRLVLWPLWTAFTLIFLAHASTGAILILLNPRESLDSEIIELVAPLLTLALAHSATTWLKALVERGALNAASTSILAELGGGLSGAAVRWLLGAFPMLTGLLRPLGLNPDTADLALVTIGFVLCSSVAAAAQWARRAPVDAALPAPLTSTLAPSALRRRALITTALLVALVGVDTMVARRTLESARLSPETSAQLTDVLSRVRAREQERLLTPPAENGFAPLSVALMTSESEPMSRRDRQVVDAFRSLSFADVGTRAEVLVTLGKRATDAAREAARLDAALPLIRDVVTRPRFVAAPPLSNGFDTRLPSFTLMRNLARSLSIRALMHERAGHLDRAVDLHLLCLQWSDRMAGDGPLIYGMITLALKRVAEEGMLELLTWQRLSARDYEQIISAETNRRATPSRFSQHLENELASALTLFTQAASGELVTEDGLKSTRWLPSFVLASDRTYYTDVMLSMDRQYSTTPRGLRSQTDALTNTLYPLPDRHPIAMALLPDVHRAMLQLRVSETRSEAIRAICTLELMRLRDGAYPAALPAGFTDLVSDSGTFGYTLEGSRYTLTSTGRQVSTLLARGNRGAFRWMPFSTSP
ncbi:MAG: hypothetical protein EB084_15795 [Proteobacteria bacterium]|nr:hypothetical protein [Pseudomonadota bacterium]